MLRLRVNWLYQRQLVSIQGGSGSCELPEGPHSACCCSTWNSKTLLYDQSVLALLGRTRFVTPTASHYCADTQAMYGKMATNTTEGLPSSGMRVYVTTEAVLREQFEASLTAAG